LALTYGRDGEYKALGNCKFHLEESLRLATTDAEKHQVLIHMASIYETYFRMDLHGVVPDAVYCDISEVDKKIDDTLSRASTLDLSTGSSEREIKIARDSLLQLARRYELRDEVLKAAEVYRKLKELSENRDWGITKEIVNHSGDDEAIMKELESWSETLDAEFWAANEPSTSDLIFQRKFQKAAMNTRKLPILLRYYEESIKHFYDTPMASAFKCQYAWSLQHLAGKAERARQLYEEIFKDTAYLLTSDLDRSVAQYLWIQLAYNIAVRLIARDDYSIMLYQEAASEGTTEDRRNELLTVMLKLPPNDYPLIDWIKAGRPVAGDSKFVPRLLMLLGRRKEAKDLLEGEFLQSIELLNDDIPYNDSEAFERLANVLEGVGLEQRAKEALSAFFSAVEPDPIMAQVNDYEWPVDYNSDPPPPPPPDPEVLVTDQSLEEQVEKVKLEELGLEDTVVINEDIAGSLIETRDDENEEQETADSESFTNEENERSEPAESEPLFDEDLSNVGLSCNSCEAVLEDWRQAIYFCLYCEDVQFCEQVRLSQQHSSSPSCGFPLVRDD
jgi:hypothetical protein